MIDLDLSGPSDFEQTDGKRSSPPGTCAAYISVAYDAPGKYHGHLCLPYADSARGPAQLAVPIGVIKGQQPGPSVTLLAGIHGDEPEGIPVLLSLMDELDYQTLRGTLFFLPAVNVTALKAGLRACPLDGNNIDLCFPGIPDGSISERLAFEIMEHFIHPAELVIDMRSGGRHVVFDDCAAIRFSHNKDLQKRSEEAMIAFGLANSVRLPASDIPSSLQGAVTALNKCYVQTELGGGAGYGVQTLNTAKKGCRNILRHWKMLDDDIELSSTRLLEVRDESYYIHATDSGLYEPTAHIGHPVWASDVIARLWNPQSSAQPAQLIKSPRDAILLAAHHGGWVESGDLIAILGEEVQA